MQVRKIVATGVFGVGLGAMAFAGAGAASADSGHGQHGQGGNETTTNVSVTSVKNEGNAGQSGAAGGNVTNTSIKTWESNYTTTVNRIRDSFNTYTDNSQLSHNLNGWRVLNGNLSGNKFTLLSNNNLTFVAFSFNGAGSTNN